MNKEKLGRGVLLSMCIIIWSCCSNCPHTSHSITPTRKEMTRSRKDYLQLSVPLCPVILQRKYIYKALTPGSSLIFLKIWGRDWFCDWVHNESSSPSPSSKQVVSCARLFMEGGQSRNRRKEKKRKKKRPLSLKSLISLGTQRAEQSIPCQCAFIF